MTATHLVCLSFHSSLPPDLDADADLELVVQHSMLAVQSDTEQVSLLLRVEHEGTVLAEFRSEYQIVFEGRPAGPERAWQALELAWPYIRQQADGLLAARGLPHLLPVELPTERPSPALPPPPEFQTGLTGLSSRPLPRPLRLRTFLAVTGALEAILVGDRQWALSAVQLYGALLSARTIKQPGTRLEHHSRNDELLGALLQRVGGVALDDYRALERADQRALLSVVRQVVVTLVHDVLFRQNDMTDGQRWDSFQDDLDELLDPSPGVGQVQGGETNETLAQYSLYVTQPFNALGTRERLASAPFENIPLLNGQPLKKVVTTTYNDAGRLDILSLAEVITDPEVLFEDPDPQQEAIPLAEPTMYRLRHLHLDANADPPLLFLTDLTLDEEVAAMDLEVGEDPVTQAELERWRRSHELSARPWPPDGEAIPLTQLPWAGKVRDVKHLESWLREQNSLTGEQLVQALHVPGFDAEVVARHGSATPALLVMLAEHPSAEVRRAVAEHPRLPLPWMEQLWNDEDDVRLGLAENPELPVVLQRRLAHVNSFLVRAQVACHPQLDPELLRFLAEDDFWGVRCNVAANPSTPPSVLLALLNDSHEHVRDEAGRQCTGAACTD